MTRLLALVLCLLTALPRMAPAQETAAPQVMFGVLAFGGSEAAERRWQSTARSLQDALSPARVRLVPLTLDSAGAALEAGELHFLLTNPGHMEALRDRHLLAPMLSLVTDRPGAAQTGNRFGAVIFSRADGGPERLSGLKGVRFGAVAPEAFGGWQLARDTLLRHGLSPRTDFAELRFMGFPQTAIVEAVLSGALDAGTLRTGVIEDMIRLGDVEAGALRVLNPLDVPGFDLALSTALMPEWTLAATPLATAEMRRMAALALLARDAAPRWMPPQNHAPVRALHGRLAAADARGTPAPVLIWFAALVGLLSALSLALAARRVRAGRSAAAVPEAFAPSSPLTPREAEVLDLVAQGLTSKEIARALDISPKTVEFHRHNLLKKFSAANMADLVRRAAAGRPEATETTAY